MTLELGEHEFNGPFVSALRVEPKPGVFIILTSHNGDLDLLDIGHASNLKSALTDDNRIRQWRALAEGQGLGCAVLYTENMSDTKRSALARSLADKYSIRAQLGLRK